MLPRKISISNYHKCDVGEENLMLHAMYLILLNIRAHQTMMKEERNQQREFRVTQRPEKGM